MFVCVYGCMCVRVYGCMGAYMCIFASDMQGPGAGWGEKKVSRGGGGSTAGCTVAPPPCIHTPTAAGARILGARTRYSGHGAAHTVAAARRRPRGKARGAPLACASTTETREIEAACHTGINRPLRRRLCCGPRCSGRGCMRWRRRRGSRRPAYRSHAGKEPIGRGRLGL